MVPMATPSYWGGLPGVWGSFSDFSFLSAFKYLVPLHGWTSGGGREELLPTFGARVRGQEGLCGEMFNPRQETSIF